MATDAAGRRIPGFYSFTPELAVVHRPGLRGESYKSTISALVDEKFSRMVSFSDPIFADPPIRKFRRYKGIAHDPEIRAAWIDLEADREFVQLPIEDHTLVPWKDREEFAEDPKRGLTLDRLIEAVKLIQRLVGLGHRVVMYCAAGVGRCGPIYAAYLYAAYDTPVEETIEKINKLKGGGLRREMEANGADRILEQFVDRRK